MDGGTWIRRTMNKGNHFNILVIIGVYPQGYVIEKGMISAVLYSFNYSIKM